MCNEALLIDLAYKDIVTTSVYSESLLIDTLLERQSVTGIKSFHINDKLLDMYIHHAPSIFTHHPLHSHSMTFQTASDSPRPS